MMVAVFGGIWYMVSEFGRSIVSPGSFGHAKYMYLRKEDIITSLFQCFHTNGARTEFAGFAGARSQFGEGILA